MSISAVILTYNEEKHIARCIDSLLPFVEHVYVLDSFSTDKTIDILSSYQNVSVKQNSFLNHATQFNFALEYFDINSQWVMRIDADEYVNEDFSHWISTSLPLVDDTVNGICINRYMKFMGHLLRYGGMSSYWILRVWRNGFGRCEQRWMDEHIILSKGKSINAKGKLIDDNLNTLSWWSHKHVDYSTREAIDVLLKELNTSEKLQPSLLGGGNKRTRFFKSYYNKFPLFLRPFLYFIYRYLLRFGFLDGKPGFLWCFLQGFWYRMMVDAKVYEIKKSAKLNNLSIESVVKEKYGYEI